MRKSLAMALVAGLAAAANATPRETLTFTNVNSDGLENAATNTVVTQAVTGGYPVTKFRINATLSTVSPFTYQSEAIIKITPPGQPAWYLTLSGNQAEFTQVQYVNVDLWLPEPIPTSAGTWEVRLFEDYDDAGIDARWDNLSITLDDEVPTAEQGDAGSLPATAETPVGSGPLTAISGNTTGDEDLFKIQICDPANFMASTVGGTGLDTRLFLFDMNGMGVTYNDDYEVSADEYYYQSRLVNPGTLVAGEYYLGITVYQRMAVDAAGQVLWNNTPYETQRAPDGPGAANAIAGWTGTPFETTGSYVINLAGVCFVGPTGPQCGPQDFNGDGDSGTDQDIEAFFACLGGTCCPTCYAGGADFNGDGDTGTDQDIEAFFRVLGGNPC